MAKQPTKATNKRTIDAAGRRVAKKGEPEHAKLLEKDPTDMQEFFAAWITEKTGYDVDLQSTILASILRPTFQKSPENQQRLADQAERVAAEAAAKEERKAARAERAAEREQAKAERAAAAKEKKAAKAAAPTKKTTAKAAPAKKTAAKPAPKAKAAPAKKVAGKAAPRRRPAKVSAGDDF